MWFARFGGEQAVLLAVGVWLVVLSPAAGCGFPGYSFPGAPDAPDACSGPDCGLACAPGYADCNDEADDGCETTLGSDSACTACGVECSNAHGATRCAAVSAAGTTFTSTSVACQPTCAVGFADCDLNPNNGCESDINSDPTHCGACAKVCSANGGTPQCLAGVCGVSACNNGFGDCTNSGSCDFNLSSDPLNCGRCGHVCSAAHGTPACNGGLCQVNCDAGYGDCNAFSPAGAPPPDDGCETKLNQPDSSGGVPNCGACGANCGRRSYTTIDLEQCALGVCARNCLVGDGDCDDNRNDPACVGSSCGCEVSFSSNAGNCGVCGHACMGGACVNHACQCPDTKPKSGSTKCTLASTVSCGAYTTGCHCVCKSGVFQCTDGAGKAC